jgi:hypothetical protein
MASTFFNMTIKIFVGDHLQQWNRRLWDFFLGVQVVVVELRTVKRMSPWLQWPGPEWVAADTWAAIVGSMKISMNHVI